MTEAPILKENLSKDKLITLLTSAVEGARSADGNVLGVVLYGSRSQDDGAVRPDSDVDLLYVLRAAIKSASSSHLLRRLIESRLEPYGIELHGRSGIYLNWIEGHRKHLRLETERICWVLDKNSVFIIPDPEVAQKVFSFVQPEGREWHRARMRKWLASPQILVSD